MASVYLSIPLKPYSLGLVAIINKDKARQVARISTTWYAHQPNGNTYSTYARTDVWKHNRRKRVYLHRIIAKAQQGDTVDHIDGDGLNCRSQNLRLCTVSQNAANRKGLQVNNMSGYHGVYWVAHAKKWCSKIQFQGKSVWIGYFDDKKEAAHNYNQFAKELFGEYATQNRI